MTNEKQTCENEKVKCGLIGKTLGHSYSPEIHALLGDYEYKLYEMPEDAVGDFLKNADYHALNVTIPYKKTVMPFLDEISDEARRIGSVNTITRTENGGLRGDNTDYYGFSYMIDRAGIELSGKKVLILGSGGASMTARTVAADRGAGEIVIVSRSGEVNYENIDSQSDCDVIINTTPVGMYPNAGVAPVSLELFPELSGVCDMIYNPATTAIVAQAKKRGIKAVTGLAMLTAQAKMAAELFTGRKISDDVLEGIIETVSRNKKNILLVGMPGSGKTTIGTQLAELTGRRFIDTDELIVERAGRSIPDIFKERGEAAFRELERDVISEVSQLSTCVIATGGGAVVRTDNRDLLRQNSTVVFLRRDIAKLPKSGRPISQSRDLDELFAERLPMYTECADFEFAVESDDVRENAAAILRKAGFDL